MAKIVIDPGHGGIDSGATGNGIIEKDLNLKISQYIYDRLKNLGVNVKITRDTDETLSPEERVNRIMNAFGDSSDVVVISNHVNAGGGDGAEVIYALRNNDTLSNLILNELANEGQNIRKSFQKRLPSNPSKDYYFIHRNTGNTEPVIIEYGFLDSKLDDPNQLKNNWQGLAEGVTRALLEYLNINYVPISDLNYIVKKGDTLWSIAKKNNITVEELKKANNLSDSKIVVGETIIIPKGNTESVDYNTYRVKAGDTLYRIAKTFNTSVNDIIKLNNLISTNLSINQILKIPNGESSVLKYTVKKGDTLYRIAREFNTSVDKIKELNNLVSDILSIGQILTIK